MFIMKKKYEQNILKFSYVKYWKYAEETRLRFNFILINNRCEVIFVAVSVLGAINYTASNKF